MGNEGSPAPALVVLIGASGSGKTTIARALADRRPDIHVRHFDQIGVPSTEEMIARHGSAEEWQRATTIAWMARLAELGSTQNVLFEGQTRLSFLAEGARAAGDLAYVPVLVDCDDAARAARLRDDRHQPELASADMMTWARYLRTEAGESGCTILDTSSLSVEQSVERVLESFPVLPR